MVPPLPQADIAALMAGESSMTSNPSESVVHVSLLATSFADVSINRLGASRRLRNKESIFGRITADELLADVGLTYFTADLYYLEIISLVQYEVLLQSYVMVTCPCTTSYSSRAIYYLK
jgi:hypothetical protein